jgi:hypothetical protein
MQHYLVLLKVFLVVKILFCNLQQGTHTMFPVVQIGSVVCLMYAIISTIAHIAVERERNALRATEIPILEYSFRIGCTISKLSAC